MIIKTNFNGSPHIGIFTISNEDFSLVPHSASEKYIQQVKEVLETDIVRTSICRTNFIAIYAAANSKFIFAPSQIEPEELKVLKDHFSEVVLIGGNYNAVGNMLALNDYGAICAKEIKETVKDYIDTHSFTIADTPIVGSAIRCSNNGFVCHRDTSDEEIKLIEKALKVKGDVGTINFGDPFVKCGLVLNSKGILVGEMSSGPELNRIDDIFVLNR